eukprot:TRINITY_DN61066_c0_g1_i1.p1 TRINITY_DN61066_c0_g1~~TRINITY_DN61066_c0_g1_i1.p1  ORF type:complete len:409 (-),score=63.48 TRINITY_DN61066_c0_g1_i1:335-1465(-)
MARPAAYGQGAVAFARTGVHADDFVAMLRHLADAAAREASPSSLRGGRPNVSGRVAAAAQLGVLSQDGQLGRMRILLARFECTAKYIQDWFSSIAFVVCIVVLKLAVRVVALHRVCMCGCRRSNDGQVDKLTSLQWTLTNMIIQLAGLWQERSSRQRTVTEFLGKHRISVSLSTRVRKYIDRSQPQQIRDTNIDALRKLSTELLVDLHEEMRVPSLSAHPFFLSLRAKHPHLVRELCHEALEPLLKCTDEFVFGAGEACSQMYFIVSGHVLYTGHIKDPDPRRSHDGSCGVTQIRRTLHGGQWLSEAALWTGWVHRGELRVVTDCLLFTLGASGFARVISSHKSAHVFAAGYARKFVETLNRGPQTDLIEAAQVDQ